jgi:hypothetical protein
MVRLFLTAGLVVATLAAPVVGDGRKVEPISPKDGVIRLFNGKDCSGLYTWLEDTQRADPRKVFTVTDRGA